MNKINVIYQQNPMWDKWGFKHTPIGNIDKNMAFTSDDYKLIEEYYDCIEHCHDAVCFFLEKYPEYPFRTPGHYYFDVVNQVAKKYADRAVEIMEHFNEKKKRLESRWIIPPKEILT